MESQQIVIYLTSTAYSKTFSRNLLFDIEKRAFIQPFMYKHLSKWYNVQPNKRYLLFTGGGWKRGWYCAFAKIVSFDENSELKQHGALKISEDESLTNNELVKDFLNYLYTIEINYEKTYSKQDVDQLIQLIEKATEEEKRRQQEILRRLDEFSKSLESMRRFK